nr:MAG TPA: hypothetical protein [Caudoviricetes sp.]
MADPTKRAPLEERGLGLTFYVMRIADENGRNNIANKVNKTRHDRPPEGNQKEKRCSSMPPLGAVAGPFLSFPTGWLSLT